MFITPAAFAEFHVAYHKDPNSSFIRYGQAFINYLSELYPDRQTRPLNDPRLFYARDTSKCIEIIEEEYVRDMVHVSGSVEFDPVKFLEYYVPKIHYYYNDGRVFVISDRSEFDRAVHDFLVSIGAPVLVFCEQDGPLFDTEYTIKKFGDSIAVNKAIEMLNITELNEKEV